MNGPVISLMVAVPHAAVAVEWYRTALGATELWNLGSVVGLEVQGAPFFLAEPASNGWETPGHDAPWGTHRQGGFYDPFGHLWLVGDTSPLSRFP
jgi:PhnB protein